MRKSAVFLLCLVLLAACGPADKPVEPAQAAATAAATENGESTHTVQAPDGVTIHYDDQGTGALTLVFVHGWNCDRSYWRAQREFFAESHRVVTLDLAGHGDSGLDRANWTMQAFGEDVASVVSALDLQNVVLIGHSMGGKVVVEAATQLAGRVVAVVGVDTFHNGGRETPKARQNEVKEGLDNDYEGYIQGIVTRMFVEQSDPQLKERIMADMAAAPYSSAIGSRNATGNYDATPTIASLGVPLKLISSDYLATDIAHLKANAKTFEYREMTGVGHFVMLEDPETFNALLFAVLADIT